MSYFEENRIVEIYKSKRFDEFIFPEIEQGMVNPEKMAIAVSGGGTRSMVASIGYFRGLYEYNPNFLENVSYLSGISGGSWFNTIIGYSTAELEELLGKSINVWDISNNSLILTNFKQDSLFIGNVVVSCPFVDTFFQAAKRVPQDRVFELMCGTLFLKKYDLQFKVPVINQKHVDLNREFNCVSSVMLHPKRPFTITTGTVLDNDLIECGLPSPAIEYTPLYTGIRVPNEKYGGLLFGNQGFQCDYQKISNVEDQVIGTHLNFINDNTTLSTGIAVSGSAYAADVFTMGESFLGGLLGNYNLNAKVWGVNSRKEHKVELADGTFHDYTGIIPLVARGCKKILCFVNCQEFKKNYCDFGLAHLFGVEQDLNCSYSEYRCGNTQIFHVKDWVLMREHFDECEKTKTLKSYKCTIDVMKNKSIGVNGDYQVEIIFVVLSQDKKFVDQLNIDFNDPNFRDLKSFPNTQLMFEKDGKVLEMTRQQVNISSSYCHWAMNEVISLYPSFFESLKDINSENNSDSKE